MSSLLIPLKEYPPAGNSPVGILRSSSTQRGSKASFSQLRGRTSGTINELDMINEDTMRSQTRVSNTVLFKDSLADIDNYKLHVRVLSCDAIKAIKPIKPVTVQMVRKQQQLDIIQLKQRQLFLNSTQRNCHSTERLKPMTVNGDHHHQPSNLRDQRQTARSSSVLRQRREQYTPNASPAILDSTKRRTKDENFDEVVKSSIDQELQTFKYQNPKVLEIQRKQNIQNFIYDKKFQNKLKYSERSKINTTALPVPQGSISVMLNVQKKDYGFNLSHFKPKIPQKSKFKMKWKTIQWLLQTKHDVIKQLFSNYSLMLKFAQNKKGGMDRMEFGELLSYVGLGAETNLGDKLFYIFDDDNSGTVDYKELIIGLEMFKENSVHEKLKVFMDLCDTDRDGKISPEELYKILKQNMFNEDDRIKLKAIVRQIFKECDTNGDGALDKEELYQATSNSMMLLALLKESVRSIKRIDQVIESDLEEPFAKFVPISANISAYKDGIHFKLVDKILNVFKEAESCYQYRKDSRKMFNNAVSLGKTKRELELLKQDSLNLSHIDE